MILLDTTRRPTQRARDAQLTERRVSRRGIEVVQAMLIARPAQELYAFWRDLTLLPRFMSHLERVEVLPDGRSHWEAKAPRIAGGSVTWDAEITGDDPGRRIAWRSLPGGGIDTIGEVRFDQALGDRGTEVRVRMRYVPPAGRVGHALATLFGAAPGRQMREDLRSFKRLMETGEVPTTVGQPTGTCHGHGKRSRT